MNHSWRETILKEFIPQLSPLTLVADPDSLLSDEDLQESLREVGFTLVEYQDPIAFRYFFETAIRPSWVAAEQQEWIIVLHAPPSELQQLPYDLLRNGRQLYFSLSDLFPTLTYHEVAILEKSDLDALYQAQATVQPNTLGENGSRDFILRHVFGLDAGLVKDEADLLVMLLRLHVRKRPLPAPFANRLLKQLQERDRFAEWPLAALLTDSSALFTFLQERWPIYLDKESAGDEKPIHDTISKYSYSFQWPGPALLPFGQAEIRALVDTLFLEGKLRPVSHPLAHKLRQLWVNVGLQSDPALDKKQRLTRLLDDLSARLPADNAGYQDWMVFAALWAAAIVLQHAPVGEEDKAVSQRFMQLQTKVDVAFSNWLLQRYKYLSTLSPHPPVMVHHIPRSLARSVTPHGPEKKALLVMDGMSFDQWLIVRRLLAEQLPDMRFNEGAVFAWIPTVTAVSRQALFAGKSPLYFPDSVHTTAKDAHAWSHFWESQGLTPSEIGYEKKLRSTDDLGRVDQLLTHPKMRLVGLVVDQIDHMMHGMTLGLTGLHDQIRLWMKAGFLTKLVERLTQAGYEIYLTSDHGNIATTGIGRPGEGALANLRGERVRIYPNDTLRRQVQDGLTTAVSWSTEGLPPHFYPLLAPNRQAFITEGDNTVTHGGHLLEEVVVPYVKLMRNGTKV